MNEDITLNPTSGASGMQEMQHEELTREKPRRLTTSNKCMPVLHKVYNVLIVVL